MGQDEIFDQTAGVAEKFRGDADSRSACLGYLSDVMRCPTTASDETRNRSFIAICHANGLSAAYLRTMEEEGELYYYWLLADYEGLKVVLDDPKLAEEMGRLLANSGPPLSGDPEHHGPPDTDGASEDA